MILHVYLASFRISSSFRSSLWGTTKTTFVYHTIPYHAIIVFTMTVFPNQKQITDIWRAKKSGSVRTVASGGKTFILVAFTAVGDNPPSENGANRYGLLKTTHGKTKYVLPNDNKPAFNDANKKVLITHWLGSWGKKQLYVPFTIHVILFWR